MIEADKRKAIFLLHEEGMGLREIARRLKVRLPPRSAVETVAPRRSDSRFYNPKFKKRFRMAAPSPFPSPKFKLK